MAEGSEFPSAFTSVPATSNAVIAGRLTFAMTRFPVPSWRSHRGRAHLANEPPRLLLAFFVSSLLASTPWLDKEAPNHVSLGSR